MIEGTLVSAGKPTNGGVYQAAVATESKETRLDTRAVSEAH